MRLDKEILRRAIADHIRRHGERDWWMVRDRFKEFSVSTFWRTVRDVRDNFETVLSAPVPSPQSSFSVPEAVVPRSANDPDFCFQTDRVIAAADMMERESMRAVDGAPQIVDHKKFKDAQELRIKALRLKGQFSYAFELIRDKNDLTAWMISELDRMDPEMAQRFLKRFHILEAVESGPKDDTGQTTPDDSLKRQVGARLDAVLTFCQYVPAVIVQFLGLSGEHILNSMREGMHPPDVHTLRRLACLQFQPGVRLNILWLLTGEGCVFLAAADATPEMLESLQPLNAKAQVWVADVQGYAGLPEHLRRFSQSEPDTPPKAGELAKQKPQSQTAQSFEERWGGKLRPSPPRNAHGT